MVKTRFVKAIALSGLVSATLTLTIMVPPLARALAQGDGPSVNENDTVQVELASAGIAVDITPDSQTISQGNNANFTIKVSNTGSITLTNLTVLPPFPTCDSGGGPLNDTLGPGANRNYSCTVNNVQDGFINSVTVQGTAEGTVDTVTDSDAAKVFLDELQPPVCPANMIAYWKLDDPSGTTFDDFYSGHNGTCSGGSCPTSLTKGRVNGALAFDGTNTKIDASLIPGDDSFDWGPTDSFSIEFWMKSDPGSCTGPENEVIVGRDDSSTQLHWWLGCQTGDGTARFRLADTAGNFRDLKDQGPAINDGAWHHVAGVRDGTNNVNRLYVDGTQVASGAKVYAAGFDSTSAALNIGWLDLSSEFHFNGTIDEVATYGGVLPPAEISDHYNNGIPGPSYCGGQFAPTITSIPATTADVDEVYTYNVQAVGDPTPTLSLNTKPSGMNIAGSIISWTPVSGDEGQHTVVVEAANIKGTDTQTYTVFVGATPIYIPIVFKEYN